MMTTEKSETEWSPLLIEEAQTAAIQVLDEFFQAHGCLLYVDAVRFLA